jgi:hypothetical protein
MLLALVLVLCALRVEAALNFTDANCTATSTNYETIVASNSQCLPTITFQPTPNPADTTSAAPTAYPTYAPNINVCNVIAGFGANSLALAQANAAAGCVNQICPGMCHTLCNVNNSNINLALSNVNTAMALYAAECATYPQYTCTQFCAGALSAVSPGLLLSVLGVVVVVMSGGFA